MLKIISFVLVLSCAVSNGTPVKKPSISFEMMMDEATNIIYKDITREKLTTKQLDLFATTAEELNVTTDTLILFVRMSSGFATNLLQNQAKNVSQVPHLHKANEFSQPSEVTVEKISQNQPDVMDKFKKLDASNDEILFMTRQDVLGGKESIQKNDDWDVFGSLRDMQLEPTLCPVPPKEMTENPSNEEMQNYIRQIYSYDAYIDMKVVSFLKTTIQRMCSVPVPVLKVLREMWIMKSTMYNDAKNEL